MSAGDYLLGVLCFGGMLAAVSIGAWLLLRKRFPSVTGLAGLVAFGVLTTAGVLAVHLLPGILGILARGSVLVCSVAWLALAILVPPKPSAQDPEADTADPDARIATVLAAASVAAVAIFTLAFARDTLTVAPLGIDNFNFHIPDIASWIQTGSLWGIHEFVADVAPGRYPQNGDLVLLAAILPWHSDFLSHLVPYVFYAFIGLAAYATAIELRASRAAAAASACLLLAIPVVAVTALSDAYPDAIMLAAFVAGVLFLLRHRRTSSMEDLVLAGLALGISFGTKWYAVSSVAILFGVWIVARLIEQRNWRTVATQGGIVAGLIALAGGFWLLRNLVESGNPVFPVKVDPLGITIFDAPRDTFRESLGSTIADYIDDPSVWSEHILPAFGDALSGPGAVLVAGLLLLLALAAWPRARERLGDAGLLFAGLACAVLLVGAYAITPYTAGGPPGEPLLVISDARYLIPALAIVAPMLAWATRLHRFGPAVLAGVALVAVIMGIRISVNPILSTTDLEWFDWAQALFGAGALVFAAWVGMRLVAGRSRRWRLTAAAGTVGVVALVAVAAGNRIQDTYHANRYVGIDPTADWVRENAPSGARIGIAGNWLLTHPPPLPAFGPRLENEVSYIGPFVDEMLREHSSPEAFTEQLESEDVDYLIVGRGLPDAGPAPEEAWAQRAGYRRVVEGAGLVLLAGSPR